MATTPFRFLQRRTAITGRVPNPATLYSGELYVQMADGTMYFTNTAGELVTVLTDAAGFGLNKIKFSGASAGDFPVWDGTKFVSYATGDLVSDLETGVLSTVFAPTGNYVLGSQTGNFITSFQTGVFVPISATGNFVTSSQTGSLNYITCPSSPSSGCIICWNGSNWIAATAIGQGGNNGGDYVTTGQTGNFVTVYQTGQFAPTGNYVQLINDLVPSQYLPSYVDEVLEFGSIQDFCGSTGNLNYIYVISGCNSFWRWGGSQYVEIHASPGTSDGIAEGINNLYFTSQRSACYVTKTETGIFNTTFAPVGNYVTTSQTGNFITTSQTGSFAKSGSYVTTSQTGQFARTGNYVEIVNGLVPSQYLPSYVDEILEFASIQDFCNQNGNSNYIYVISGCNSFWRWGGSQYVEIYASPGTSDGIAEGINNLYFTNQRSACYVTRSETGLFAISGDYITTDKTGSFIDSTMTGNFVDTSMTGTFIDTSMTGSFGGSVETGSLVGQEMTGNFVDTSMTGTFIDTSMTGSLNYVTCPSSPSVGCVICWNGNNWIAGNAAGSASVPTYYVCSSMPSTFILNGSGNLICGISGLSGSNFNHIVGGSGNCLCSITGFGNILGGCSNLICGGRLSLIVGGGRNFNKNSLFSTIVGGLCNSNCDSVSAICGAVVVGGCCNVNIGSDNSSIVGGCNNLNCRNCLAFIGGGYYHTTSFSCFGSIVGGWCHTLALNSHASTIAGGCGNLMQCSITSFISAGCNNSIRSSCDSSILAGNINTICNSSCSAALGTNNLLSGVCNSFILGNSLTGTASSTTYVNNLCVVNGVISGNGAGITGLATGSFVITSQTGVFAPAAGTGCFVTTGQTGTLNYITCPSSPSAGCVVCWNGSNWIAGTAAGGGGGGTVSLSGCTFSDNSSILGNCAVSLNAIFSSPCSVILGGSLNCLCSSPASAVDAGCCNIQNTSCFSFIGAGVSNCQCCSCNSFVGAGLSNIQRASICSFMGAGRASLQCCSALSFIGAGQSIVQNNSFASAIIAGISNVQCSSSSYSFIGAGASNTMGTSTHSFMGTPCCSIICNAPMGAIVVGCSNRISGLSATFPASNSAILGGINNTISGSGVSNIFILGSGITGTVSNTTYVNDLCSVGRVFGTLNGTGSFVTTSQTGQFAPAAGTGSFVITSQTGNFVTTSQTGTLNYVACPTSPSAGCVICWNGSSWIAGTAAGGGGGTTLPNGTSANSAIRWDGLAWTTGQTYVATGQTGSFVTMSQTGTLNYVTCPSSPSAGCVICWNGSNWIAAEANIPIIGGCCNCQSFSSVSSIVGGCCNCQTFPTLSFIVGGTLNCQFCSTLSSILGGNINCQANSNCSSIGGGSFNYQSGTSYSSIVGGCSNCQRCSTNYSSIGGGAFNYQTGASYSSIVGGNGNCQFNLTNSSFIGGGSYNYQSGVCHSSIVNGCSNCQRCSANYSSIVGGAFNCQSGSACYSFIGGGNSNSQLCSSNSSSIVGGTFNCQSGACHSFIGGGDANCQLNGLHLSIVGGSGNCQLASDRSFIGGGICNSIRCSFNSNIIGGFKNFISGASCNVSSCVLNSAILAGQDNAITGSGVANIFILGSGITANASNTTYVNNLCVVSGVISGNGAGITGLATGNFVATSQTGQFAPAAGTGSFVTTSQTGNFLTVIPISGCTLTCNNTLVGNSLNCNLIVSTDTYPSQNSAIIAGKNNCQSGIDESFIAGGCLNKQIVLNGVEGGSIGQSAILAGTCNIQCSFCSVDEFQAYNAIIGGFRNSQVGFNAGSLIAAGFINCQSGTSYSFMGGGCCNMMSGSVNQSAIIGGFRNTLANVNNSFILGCFITGTCSNTTYVNNLCIWNGGRIDGGINVVTTGQTGAFATASGTGSFVTTSQTGVFVLAANTGNFVTTGQTGNFITTQQTGAFGGGGGGGGLSTGSGYLAVNSVLESLIVCNTGAGGNLINFDVIPTSTLYYTCNSSGNFSLNLRGNSSCSLNCLMPINNSLSISFIHTNGAVSYSLTGISIDGTGRAVRWASISGAPVGASCSTNVYSITAIKTGNDSYTIFGSLGFFV